MEGTEFSASQNGGLCGLCAIERLASPKGNYRVDLRVDGFGAIKSAPALNLLQRRCLSKVLPLRGTLNSCLE